MAFTASCHIIIWYIVHNKTVRSKHWRGLVWSIPFDGETIACALRPSYPSSLHANVWATERRKKGAHIESKMRKIITDEFYWTGTRTNTSRNAWGPHKKANAHTIHQVMVQLRASKWHSSHSVCCDGENSAENNNSELVMQKSNPKSVDKITHSRRGESMKETAHVHRK